jgi:hypothetical protein
VEVEALYLHQQWHMLFYSGVKHNFGMPEACFSKFSKKSYESEVIHLIISEGGYVRMT